MLRIQALTMVTAFLLATWNFGLLSLKRFREIMLANLSSATVSVAGTLALGSRSAPQGAAIAVVAAEGAVALASLYYLRRVGPGFAPQLGVVPEGHPGRGGGGGNRHRASGLALGGPRRDLRSGLRRDRAGHPRPATGDDRLVARQTASRDGDLGRPQP